VIACSVSAPDYRLVDNPAYPNIVQDFESSIAKLRALPCDIFLAGHGWDFGLQEKIQASQAPHDANPWVDPQGYRRYLDKAQAAIEKQVAEQKKR
jgi:metallo-beta-lactamase class B